MHVTVNTVTFEGKPAVLEASDTNTSISMLGITVTENVKSRMYAQTDGQTPIYETVEMSSSGVSTSTTARFFDDHIDATLVSGGQSSPTRVPIPQGVKVAAMDADQGILGGPALKKGDVIKEITFNPVTLVLDPVKITVTDTGLTAQDNLVGTVNNVTKCMVETPEGDATVYQDPAGTPVRVEMIAGLLMVRQAPPSNTTPPASEPSASAPATYTPPDDFAIASSVAQSNKVIDSPRQCTYLKAQLERTGQPTNLLEIHSFLDPEQADGTLADTSADATLAPYLADSLYLNLTSDPIRQQAKTIAGTSTNLAQIVCKVHDWVNTNMTPVGTIGVPRAASSVLGDRRGVCRDYAILYVALARAAGVPTKLCGGIVAYKDRFYYHAWAESFIGKSAGWVAVDPTVPGRFVDATHIALTRGNPADMFSLTNDIGNVKVTVLQTEN